MYILGYRLSWQLIVAAKFLAISGFEYLYSTRRYMNHMPYLSQFSYSNSDSSAYRFLYFDSWPILKTEIRFV